MSSIPKNKSELEHAINDHYSKLMKEYRSVPISLSRDLGIEGNIKGTSISVCDTLSYLIGWGKLVLKWHERRNQGLHVDFPETGFKWNQLGQLAEQFHSQYRDWSYEELLNEFELVTKEIQALIRGLSDSELYGSEWYEKYTLGRMIQLNGSSPMKNIRAKVRKFKKTNNIS